MYLFKLVFYISSDKYPEVDLLGHNVALFLIFLRIPHAYIILHLSEWLLSINQQTTSVGENVEKRESSCIIGVTIFALMYFKEYFVFFLHTDCFGSAMHGMEHSSYIESIVCSIFSVPTF